jgi:hypothetical protein
LEAALTAKTYVELAVVLRDPPAVGASPAQLSTAKAAVLIAPTASAATLSKAPLLSRPERMEVKVTSGNLLDFADGKIIQRVPRVNAGVKRGDLRLITEPGIVVDVGEVAVRSYNIMVKTSWVPPRRICYGWRSQERWAAAKPRPARRTVCSGSGRPGCQSLNELMRG